MTAAVSLDRAPATNRAGDHLSPSGFDYNRIAGVRGNRHVTPAFLREVEAMAGRLGTRPEYLLAVMSFETGESFRPDVRNGAGSGATGLIQFMPGTARELGTSTDALARMSSVEQLEYVERYFNRRSDPGDLRTLEGVYTTVLYGSPRPDPGSTLFARGSSAYSMNAPLDTNRDGRITAGEATSFVRRKIDGDAPPPGNDPPANDPPSGDPPAGGRYTVRSGDTLSGIAARHGTSVRALMAANPQIHDPDRIYAGQTIHLPGGGGDAPAPDRSGGRYTIRGGDTLSAIAARHGTSVSKLMALNPQIQDPDRIYAGQSLRLPGGDGGGTRPASHDYTVRSGDTLSGIAARSDTTVGALMAANPQIRDSDLIYAGQTIRIPGAGAPANDPPADQPADPPRRRDYTVRSGDTLSGIAARHDTSVGAILGANPQITNPDRIYAGQVIRLPGSGPVDGPSGPGPSGGADGQRVADIARTFLGRNASELKRSGDLPMNPNVPSNVCCANFVSAVLQKAGLLDRHTDLVTGSRRDSMGDPNAIGAILKSRGWRVVPASQARPGDVAIVNNGHHVELVYGNKGGDITLIGSNNVNSDGTQRVSWGNPYGNAWYLSPPR